MLDKRAADPWQIIAELRRERDAASQQQAAIAEVLKAISRSAADLDAVLHTVVTSAIRLCRADQAVIYRNLDGAYRWAAGHSLAPEYERIERNIVITPGPGTLVGRAAVEGRTVQIEDAWKDPLYEAKEDARIGGIHSMLGVPLLRDGAVIGVIGLARRRIEPYGDREIELVTTFADQAVIAIENSRLLSELRNRSDELARRESALRASEERYGLVTQAVAEGIYDWNIADNRLWVSHRLIELFGWQDTGAGAGERPSQEWNALVHPEDFATYRAALRAALKGDTPRLVCEYRIRLGSDEFRWVEDHAVPVRDESGWAVRLVGAVSDVTERKERERELQEALEQQTATAEVLQVINSSPGDLAPVFDALLEKATRLCEAAFGSLLTYDGEYFQLVAHRGERRYDDVTRPRGPYRSEPGSTIEALVNGESVVHVLDLTTDQKYRASGPVRRALVEIGGARTYLSLALRKDGALVGALNLYRQEVRAFTEKEIALLRNFAAQAVIAMENARLLTELRERQQELRVTFENIGDGVAMFDEAQQLVAWNRNFQNILDLPDDILAQSLSYSDFVRYLAERGEYGAGNRDEHVRRLTQRAGQFRAYERRRPDGRMIDIRHNPVPEGGFVLIYADITERKRAEEAVSAARDTAEKALGDLRAAQASLIQAEKMASLGQLTAGIAHEIKNPLNFVNNFAGLSVELLDELKESAAPGIATLDDDTRAEIDEAIEMLTGNLEKITEHGRRADNIVKSMLEHSRGVTGERREVDVNGLVQEALNLAYHGARAQDQNFNITMERDLDSSLAPVELVPQDIMRVFLNLIGNGFHAAHQRHRQAVDPGFRPVVKVATREVGDAVEVRVRDNGTGIRPEHRDKLFQPFFTTKPAGEGTGLGLSISYDIVTQEHGGTITVDSEPGSFTEFTVRLPRAGRSRARRRRAADRTTGRAA